MEKNNIFDYIKQIDNKNYDYYDSLLSEEKDSVPFYMLMKWLVSIKNNPELFTYYVYSVDYYANKYGYSDLLKNHPKLKWLLLCASSPKIKYAQREWVSHVPESFNLLKEEATAKKIKKYYDNTADANEYISQQNRKYFLANQYSMLKLEDIEVLNKVVTDDEIKSYKQDSGF
jgi:uncharacterized protein YaaR (DUF327 family)